MINYYTRRSARFEFKKDPDNGEVIGPDGVGYCTEAEAMYCSLGCSCGCGQVHGFIIRCLEAFDRDKGKRGTGIDALVARISERPVSCRRVHRTRTVQRVPLRTWRRRSRQLAHRPGKAVRRDRFTRSGRPPAGYQLTTHNKALPGGPFASRPCRRRCSHDCSPV